MPHFFEPGLDSRLKRVIKSGNLLIKKQIPDQWNGSVYIITVGTPLDENKRVRLDMVKNVSSEVASHMKCGSTEAVPVPGSKFSF